MIVRERVHRVTQHVLPEHVIYKYVPELKTKSQPIVARRSMCNCSVVTLELAHSAVQLVDSGQWRLI